MDISRLKELNEFVNKIEQCEKNISRLKEKTTKTVDLHLYDDCTRASYSSFKYFTTIDIEEMICFLNYRRDKYEAELQKEGIMI